MFIYVVAEYISLPVWFKNILTVDCENLLTVENLFSQSIRLLY